MATGPTRTLTHAQARAFYDRFAPLQDWQAVYEGSALERLIRDAELGHAHAVVELGCGTGRLAERLLTRELPADATYLGLDVSPEMVARTRRRIAPFGSRADVRATEGSLRLPLAESTCDRFIAAYVLDLLSEDDIQLAVDEAYRVLIPGGRLCAASLSQGTTWASRLTCRAWSAVQARAPVLVGGCRPVDLLPHLGPGSWDVAASRIVVAFAIPTQVVVASATKTSG